MRKPARVPYIHARTFFGRLLLTKIENFPDHKLFFSFINVINSLFGSGFEK